MTKATYDIVTVGGGLGGSALARTMAQRGASVLVLEREKKFRDRVRGEYLSPWGVAEVARLGLDATFEAVQANHPRWVIGTGADRDLTTSTPQGLAALSFYHPAMEEAVLAAAADAGAEVCRGVSVKSVTLGAPATVEFDSGHGTEAVAGRLVVGADGRSSNFRNWAKFTLRRDPDRLIIAGVLLEGGKGFRDDAAYLIVNPAISQGSVVTPLGDGRLRVYFVYRADSDLGLHGHGSLPQFIDGCIQAGVPPDFVVGTTAVGPLASFNAADNWVDHPYRDGLALIGDAAAASDPSWGQGMGLTLRDVRVLSDCLSADDDWDRAGHAYAREHDRYYFAIHTSEDWLTSFFYDRGEFADARRARAFPLIMADPTRVPDHVFSGPELPIDESVRKRFFAEEEPDR